MGARVNVRVLARPGAARHDAFVEAVPPHWRLGSSVLDVCPQELVIARQFAWPYPRSLDSDLARLDAKPLNDATAYAFCDDVMEWTAALLGVVHCPRAWSAFEYLPDIPLILKGAKADKSRWSRMYAANRAEAIALRSELWRDTGMQDQNIVAREYVPLARLGESPTGGCPPCAEWRVFALDTKIVGSAPYWPAEDCTTPCPPLSVLGSLFAERALAALREACPSLRWVALDIGRLEGGSFTVVEVSDGQRAGIPDPMTRPELDAMIGRMADLLGKRP